MVYSRSRMLSMAAAGVFIAAGSTVFAAPSGLERYLEIVERAPFGEISPSEEASAPVEAPAVTFAADFEMRAIIDDGITIRVGFLDKKKQKNFSIAVGETVDGLELVSVDYDNEEALLRKGQETSLFSLRPAGAAGRAVAGEVASELPESPARRRHLFATRARQPTTRDPMSMQRDETTVPYRGKTIEDFLREHPEAAMKYPSPLRPADSSAVTRDRGETIERFLRENPDAVRQFSPFQPADPTTRVEGRGEIIERFLREHSGNMVVRPPTPVVVPPESVPFLFDNVSDDDLYYE